MVAAGLGGLLMGAGTACLHVEWGCALGDLGSGATILHGVIGTVIAALLLGDGFCPGIFVRHRSGHFTFFGHQEPVVALSAASFALPAVSLGAGELATVMVF
ncbi:MAG: hypothetical protein RR611_11145, partial [Gordonibacter sp.]